MLETSFEMKDMGEVDVILGLRVLKTSKGYCLSQAHYVEKILNKFGYFDVELARTPFDANLHLKKNLLESVDLAGYAKILGTAGFGLSYCGYPPILEGYCDANGISESNDIHSTSGYVFTLVGAAVSWRSSEQTCIAYNGKSRHIRLRHNIVYNLIKFGVILLDYVTSESNVVDPLTKALNRKLVSETAKKMGLSPPM
ncbi:hypothetical protein RND81_10G139800 [Saponaria officinalis]|uniref:Uncharacterized protein n=1 Tax=Saponaria officinalis TaxID=3572 RepID=A0AAW1I2Q6_SAPOF